MRNPTGHYKQTKVFIAGMKKPCSSNEVVTKGRVHCSIYVGKTHTHWKYIVKLHVSITG